MAYSYNEMQVGMAEQMTKTVTEADIILFAGITGDFNQAHIDETYAKKSRFKERIAHGMLSAGFISAVLGTKLPGSGAIYLTQSLQFKRPVLIGDTVTARVEIIEKIDDKNHIRFKTECFNQNQEIVITGEALMMYKD